MACDLIYIREILDKSDRCEKDISRGCWRISRAVTIPLMSILAAGVLEVDIKYNIVTRYDMR